VYESMGVVICMDNLGGSCRIETLIQFAISKIIRLRGPNSEFAFFSFGLLPIGSRFMVCGGLNFTKDGVSHDSYSSHGFLHPAGVVEGKTSAAMRCDAIHSGCRV
jgi:hypothetical protein